MRSVLCEMQSVLCEMQSEDRRTYCPLSSLAAASRHREESHLIYGPLESILIDQGFPVEYELDEFNQPHSQSWRRLKGVPVCVVD